MCFAVLTIAFKNEPDGFRTMKWGSPPPKGWQVHKTRDVGLGGKNEEIFVNPKDELKLGGVAVDSIYYGFWKNKFYCVWVIFQGYPKYGQLKAVCTAKYGEGEEEKRYDSGGLIAESSWYGARANVLLDIGGGSPGSLVIQSASLCQQKIREEIIGSSQQLKKPVDTSGF
jgi:hypothetical protein